MIALDAAGKLRPMVFTASTKTNGTPASVNARPPHDQQHAPPIPDTMGAKLNESGSCPESSVDLKAAKAIPCPFWFPEIVDAHAGRIVAAFTMIISIIAIIWRNHRWAQFLMLGLFIDSVLRLIYGAGGSVIGQAARLLASPLTPRFVPGMPKQFAAFAAVTLSGLAALFFLLTGFDPDNITGSIFAGILAFFAFLEFSIDFCAGCWMFGLAVKYKVLPRNIYALAINTKPEAIYTYKELTQHLDLFPVERVTRPFPGHNPTSIDLNYKTKTDDHSRQAFHPIKYMAVGHFNVSLAWTGLATLWKIASLPNSGMHISETTSLVFQVVATVIFCVQLILYLAKFILYPQKVKKEWMCPLRSNAFVVPPICTMLLAYCIARNGDEEFDNALVLAKVLYWIGAVVIMLMAIHLVSSWISRRHCIDHINTAWIMPPVGTFIAALVGPTLDENYTEAAYFWFAFAFVMWLILFPITFYKAIVFVDADERMRPILFIWIAPPAIASVTYSVLLQQSNTVLDSSFSPVAKTLYFMSLSFFFILGWLFVTGHFVRGKFAPSSWAYAFPLEALAIATISWASGIPGNWPHGMAITGLVIATGATALCTLQTLSSLSLKGWFTADLKYGPMSIQRLSHEGFRGAMAKLSTAVAGLDPNAPASMAIADVSRQFKDFHLAHTWHSKQEDEVLFKAFNDYFPGPSDKYITDHEEDRPVLDLLSTLIERLGGEKEESYADDVVELQKQVSTFMAHLEEHLLGEEVHLQPIGRKHICLEVQKGIMRKMWDMTPSEVWSFYLPWIINNQPMMMQRVRFIRAWLWVLPENAQLIGRMIALGVDPILWARLMEYVPEIAPRGEKHWVRYN